MNMLNRLQLGGRIKNKGDKINDRKLIKSCWLSVKYQYVLKNLKMVQNTYQWPKKQQSQQMQKRTMEEKLLKPMHIVQQEKTLYLQ